MPYQIYHHHLYKDHVFWAFWFIIQPTYWYLAFLAYFPVKTLRLAVHWTMLRLVLLITITLFGFTESLEWILVVLLSSLDVTVLCWVSGWVVLVWSDGRRMKRRLFGPKTLQILSMKQLGPSYAREETHMMSYRETIKDKYMYF